MNFMTKYRIRNRSLLILSWFFSLTGLVIAYTTIKYMKVIYYGDWMFENVDPFKYKHTLWLIDNELKVLGFPLVLTIVVTFLVDTVMRRLFIRL